MSSRNQLPPNDLEHKSVFSVFSFGEDHGLEALKAVEAAQRQKAQRRNSKERTDPVLVPSSPEAARKMRMPVPDNSKMAVQAVSSGGPAPSSSSEDLTQKVSGAPFPRRYSKAQGEEREDTFDADEVLQRFNRSMVLHKPRGFNLYESSLSDDESAKSSNKPFSNKYLRRRMSASDISKIDPAQALASVKGISQSTASDSTVSETEPSPGLLSRYLGRRGSAGSILANMSRSNINPSSTPSEQSGGDNSSALVPAASSALVAANLGSRSESTTSLDMTDGAMPATTSPQSSAGSSQGFGILSRTRQFGAWLTKATEGERVEVSRPDLNAVAPTSF